MNFLWKIRVVWAVWAVIPLVLVGFIGIQETFAEECVNDPVFLKHEIKNGIVTSMCVDKEKTSLLINIEAQNTGFLILEITRETADPEILDCSYDDIFVLRNGEEVDFVENKINLSNSILTIEFDQDVNKIEIIRAFNATHNCFPYTGLNLVNLSPQKQILEGISPLDVICNGELELILKLNEDSSVCVKSSTVKKLIEREWGEYIFENNIQISDSDLILQYNIFGAKITDVGMDNDSNDIIFNFGYNRGGDFTIEIPHPNSDCKFIEWIILSDGKETAYEEIVSTSHSILIIEFPSDTSRIDILPTGIFRGMPSNCLIESNSEEM